MSLASRAQRPAVLLFALIAIAMNAQASPRMSHTAEAYLDRALNLMQQHALHASEIDWSQVRRETMARAEGAQTTADTYPAIFYALTQLKERHSFLRLPDNLPEAEKKRAFDAMRTILAPYKNQAERKMTSVFRDRTAPSGHMMDAPGARIAYVSIPKCAGKSAIVQNDLDEFRKYTDTLHAAAAALEAQHPSGWIVDLRGNLGGNMYPMIAGIGFVIGEGVLGYFVTPGQHALDSLAGAENAWFYRKGEAGEVAGGVQHAEQKEDAAPTSLPDLPPVAVLIDSGTVSAGEAVAISFGGRPRTRVFGAHTYGLSTGNTAFPMPDGASLILCEVLEEDRLHRPYPDGIEPDVEIAEPSQVPAEDADEALQAAKQWLLTRAAK